MTKNYLKHSKRWRPVAFVFAVVVSLLALLNCYSHESGGRTLSNDNTRDEMAILKKMHETYGVKQQNLNEMKVSEKQQFHDRIAEANDGRVSVEIYKLIKDLVNEYDNLDNAIKQDSSKFPFVSSLRIKRKWLYFYQIPDFNYTDIVKSFASDEDQKRVSDLLSKLNLMQRVEQSGVNNAEEYIKVLLISKFKANIDQIEHHAENHRKYFTVKSLSD